MSLTEEIYNIEPDGPLYHYTSIQGILGILKSGAIWASHIAYLNDHSEFNHAIEIAKGFFANKRKKYRRSFDDFYYYEYLPQFLSTMQRLPYVLYVASFCDLRDSLSLWRGYCPDNGGYSFGFDWVRYKPKDAVLGPCIYDNDKKHAIIEEIIEKVMNADPEEIRRIEKIDETVKDIDDYKLRIFEFLREFYLPAAFFKDSAFREEKEWRVVIPQTALHTPKEKFRPSRTLVVPYTELNLVHNSILHIDELIVGPTIFMNAARQAIERLIESLNEDSGGLVKTGSVKIECSKISLSSAPYRSL